MNHFNTFTRENRVARILENREKSATHLRGHAYLPGAQILITIGVNDALELISAADVDDGNPVVAGVGQDGCRGRWGGRDI